MQDSEHIDKDPEQSGRHIIVMLTKKNRCGADKLLILERRLEDRRSSESNATI
jgi:hypothetical protein